MRDEALQALLIRSVLIISMLSIVCQCSEDIPVAEFEADVTTIEQGEEVQFRDISLNTPLEWKWRFEAGDPQISTMQHPKVTYYHSGEYEVRLTVSNKDGSDIINKNNYITVLTPCPEAEFTADTTVCEINGVIRFTDLSPGKPTEWEWTFQGGNPQTSTAQHPRVIYNSPGVYSVVLTVRNDRGADTEDKEEYIRVLYPRTDVTFHNNVFTDVTVSVDGETRTVPFDRSITYEAVKGFQTTYFAGTSGKTAEGVIVGESIYWFDLLDLNGSSMKVDLDLSREYVYLYLTNEGNHDLAPLYVNYGTTDQTRDDIVMKADGKKYRVGYYKANPGMKIRAYWLDDPSSYTLWEKGIDFTFHFTKNQSIHLINREK